MGVILGYTMAPAAWLVLRFALISVSPVMRFCRFSGVSLALPVLPYLNDLIGNPMSESSISKRLREELDRYRGLRQHNESESGFREKLYALQSWQSERMKRTHASLLEDAKYRPATLFFLEDIYGGVDLRVLADQAEKAINKALKILPDKVMTTSVIALELNALSAELDEKVTHYLHYELGQESITLPAYLQAFRESADKSQRDRQIALARELAIGLDKYVRSRLIYGTFRLVKKPAVRAGIGDLYAFMGKGFDAMRPMGSASRVIHKILEKEEQAIERIYEGHEDPYGFQADAR